MTKQEKFEKLYKKHRTEYFKKHFLGKNINEAMYKTSKDIITNLAAIQTQIGMFIDSLSMLRRNKNPLNV